VEAKAVIWAHNSHLGDSSQTEAGWDEGGPKKYKGREFNLGQVFLTFICCLMCDVFPDNSLVILLFDQLVRKRIGLERTFNIGFSTYNGTVTAAYNWDEVIYRR